MRLLLGGGRGSGNAGHRGRPGKLGGSSPKKTLSNFIEFDDTQKGRKESEKFGKQNIRNREIFFAQRKALEDYQETEHLWINGLLRGNNMPKNATFKQLLRNKIERLDQAMGGVSKNFVVYRGVTESVFNKIIKKDRFGDKGFVSTSLHFSNAFSNANHVLKIEVPKGTPAYYLGKDFGKDESEVLLARNLKFRVKGIYPNTALLEVIQ